MIEQGTVYDEIAQFMVSMNPEKVLHFKPSSTNQERLTFLLEKQKEFGLNKDEKNEVEHYLIINRIIGLAKARAFKMLEA